MTCRTGPDATAGAREERLPEVCSPEAAHLWLLTKLLTYQYRGWQGFLLRAEVPIRFPLRARDIRRTLVMQDSVFPGGSNVAARGGKRTRGRREDPVAADRAARRVRPGGDLAPGADGAALGPGHGDGGDRGGRLHQPGPGPRRAAQLQHRRIRLAAPPLRRRAPAEIRPGAARADQEDRTGAPCRLWLAFFHLEPVKTGRPPGGTGGGGGHFP